jgi:hypothetical protein
VAIAHRQARADVYDWPTELCPSRRTHLTEFEELGG